MLPQHRVFYHELGHFIAQETHRHFYGGLGVEGIRIWPEQNDYKGETIPERSVNYNGGVVPVERLHFQLVSLVYGCIFQTFFTGGDIGLCYREHGNEDINVRAGLLLHHQLDDIRSDLNDIDDRYVKVLQERGALQRFRRLEASQYLVTDNHGGFTVDLPRLRQDTREMIDAHLPLYAQLIEKYIAVLNRQ